MMGEGKVERSEIRIVAIDRTHTSGTDGLAGTSYAASASRVLNSAREAEVEVPHPALLRPQDRPFASPPSSSHPCSTGTILPSRPGACIRGQPLAWHSL